MVVMNELNIGRGIALNGLLFAIDTTGKKVALSAACANALIQKSGKVQVRITDHADAQNSNRLHRPHEAHRQRQRVYGHFHAARRAADQRAGCGRAQDAPVEQVQLAMLSGRYVFQPVVYALRPPRGA